MRIAHVSTFPAMKCGIAFFASDVIDGLPDLDHARFVLHYGKNETADSTSNADVNTPADLRALARAVSASGSQVVSLQHEFGIWGGADGENLLPFLEEITLPIVTTIHTTFAAGTLSAVRATLLRSLIKRSAISFVMSQSSMHALQTLVAGEQCDIRVIPYGIPDIAFMPRNELSSPGRTPHLISFGFFRPDKGLEVVVQAIRILRDEHHDCRYSIVGFPQVQFPEQEPYFRKIEALIDQQNLGEFVILDRRFLTREEQIAFIRDADAAVFAYQEPQHASSGALALTLAAGRPAICTPFEFATAAAEEIAGIEVASDFGTIGIVSAIRHFLRRRTDWASLSKGIYDATRAWTWPRVADSYRRAFGEAARL